MDSLRLCMKLICWERFLLEYTSYRTMDDLEAIWQRSVETGQSLMKSIFLGFTGGRGKSGVSPSFEVLRQRAILNDSTETKPHCAAVVMPS